MKQGPSTMLSRLPNHSTRIAIAASPAPRKTALMRNSSTTVTLPPSITRVKPLPDATTSGDAPISAQQVGGARRREERDERRHDDAEQDRLRRGARGALGVVLADAPRHQRHRADRQPHRDRVDHRQHRLGQPDRRDRVGAEVRDPEDVGDGEDRLHRHLDHHRHGQHDHGAPDRRSRVVDAAIRGSRRGTCPRPRDTPPPRARLREKLQEIQTCRTPRNCCGLTQAGRRPRDANTELGMENEPPVDRARGTRSGPA